MVFSKVPRKGPVFICAGEPSGDVYAALFIQQLQKHCSFKALYGVGGKEMHAKGVELVLDSEHLEAFGIKAAFGSLPRHLKLLHKIKQSLRKIQPRTFIAVAYPGLNLFLAQYVKKRGCQVYYLLPPQAWAWGGFRANLVKRWVDLVITVFPFEFEYYQRRGVKTVLWDNPLYEHLQQYTRTSQKPRIGFMPGSRLHMVKRNLPIISDFINHVNGKTKRLSFNMLFHSSNIGIEDYQLASILENLKVKLGNHFKVHTQNRYQAMKNCDFIVTCTGTASLEVAFMGIPQVFFHHCSGLNYHVMRRFLKIHEYNLTNIYFGKKHVPSCVSPHSGVILDFLKTIDIQYYFN